MRRTGSVGVRFVWRRALALAAMAALLGLGCSESDTGPSASDDDQLVGPAGGTVAGSGGASVVIPAGALAVETAISAVGLADIAALPESALPFLAFLGGAQFGPAGTEFALPVTISFPLDPPLPPGTAVNLLIWDEIAAAWVDEGFAATLAADGASLSAQVTHFSLFGCVGDVFDSFHAAFGDGSTAETAFASYVSWFKANVTDMNRKGLYREDCHEVKGLRFDLSYDVSYLPDGPHYQGIPYVMEGDVSEPHVVFKLSYERVEAGVVDFNYILAADVFLECCAPEVEVSAEPASISTGQTSQVTARVMCDTDAMAGHEVSFEALGGLGELSPATATVNAAGTATSTFTAGEDEGTESVRASLTTCGGAETPDGAAQIEIGGDWSADLNIAWLQDIGDPPLLQFADNMSMHLNLNIAEGVITGTGTGTHSVSLSPGGECWQSSLSAPSFDVVVMGEVTGETLDFAAIAYSIPLSLVITCDQGDDPVDYPYPIYGLLESALIAQFISVTVPWENGATDSGSGSDPSGGDIPLTWTWTCTLSGPSR